MVINFSLLSPNTLTKRTDFISNFVIVNNAPAWINFDEGRVIMDGTTVNFTETHLKDHTSTSLSTGLGNTRVVFGYKNNALAVKQVNSYYPFGMNINGLTTRVTIEEAKHPANEYLYNGKMFQDELGLDWLDYGARMYDAVLARWSVPDPLAEKYSDWSPYNYAINNPLRFIDPFGLEIKNAYEEERKQKEVEKNEVKNKMDNYKADKKSKEYRTMKRDYNKVNRQYKSIDNKYQAVEKAKSDLKEYNPELYNTLNNLTDPGGTTVDVYIESVPNLTTDYYNSNNEFNEPKSAYGLTNVKGYKNMGSYYSLQSKFGANTIGIALDYNLQDPGRYFSHEGGHAKYFAGNLKAYFKWLKDHPGASVGGHGGGNPSGEEADLQESIYLNNK